VRLTACFAGDRKPSTRAFRVEDEIELLLTVTRESKTEIAVSVGNQKSLRMGSGPVGCLALGPVSASLALTDDKTPAERSQSSCESGY
jgi:hypothetical protein